MRRLRLIFTLIFILFSFLACQKSPILVIEPGIDTYDNYDFRFVHKGDVIDFGLDRYAGDVEFDSIVIHSDEEVALADYKERLTFIEVGATRVTIDLMRNGHSRKTLDYGMFYVVDIGDEDISYVSTYQELYDAVTNYPSGIIVLTGDIVMWNTNPITTTFRGAVLNPEGYVIRTRDYVVLTHPLFDTLENAYIDGLILEGFVMENVGGALANMILSSFIANVQIDAEITSNYNYVGGLAEQAIGLRMESVVWRGSIQSDYPSGLIGVSYPWDYYRSNPYFVEHFATNCVVIASFIAIGDNPSLLSGFSRMMQGYPLSVRNSYVSGTVFMGEDDTWNLNFVTPYISLVYPLVYENLLTTIPVNPNCIGDDCLIPYSQAYVSLIDVETLTSGEVIDGFESFRYANGEYPMPPVFEIPWLS